MEWIVPLAAIMGGVLFVMALGVPVAFAFLFTSIIGVIVLQGPAASIQLALSTVSSVGTFALVSVPLFILMGVVLWHSNLGQQAIDTLDKWLGRLPGRISFLSLASGGVFSALSGSTMANTALLGTMLMPELRRRGYSRDLSMGTILAAGGLAMMIPPSALAVILASIAKLSVAKILIAAIIPGVMMALAYALYIVGRCVVTPSAAPKYEVQAVTWRDRFVSLARNLLPLGVVIFAVTGLIVLGIATPTEAAALGALSSLLLAAAYGRLSWKMLRVAAFDTMRITVMTFAIMAAAIGFSQLLAFSGATRGMLTFVMGANVSPIMLVMIATLVVFVLGCFLDQMAIMLITIPIFVPLITGLGLDPIWFAVLLLVNLETALMTPPFGLLLFVMKGIAPGESFGQIYWAAAPFVICNVLVMAILIGFPEVVTGLMRATGF